MRKKTLIFLGIAIFVFTVSVYVVYSELARKSIDEWIVSYTLDLISGDHPIYSADEATDLIFLIVDHHEHSFDNKEAEASTEQWIKDYSEAIKGITDSNGRKFQYSWFYPYDDRRTPSSLELLSEFAGKGYGDIEFHWHRGNISDEEFQRGVADAMKWFSSYGVAVPITSDKRWETAFGYVAGNWDLDNGLGRRDGESHEIDYLLNEGGYGDFTFPNSTSAQPPFYSRLYYATDSPESKSYKTGETAAVGVDEEGLLMFMGPTALDFKEMTVEFGTVEAWWYKNFQSRVDNWFRNAPTVEGKPEWRFVKTYTHGVQSRDLFTSGDFRRMLQKLLKYTEDNDLRLHFVTAREAYNIVQAAEDGLKGNPYEYRNYEIPSYVRSEVSFSRRVNDISTSDNSVMLKFDELGPVQIRVGNQKERVINVSSETVLVCNVYADNPMVITNKEPIKTSEDLVYRHEKKLKFSEHPNALDRMCADRE